MSIETIVTLPDQKAHMRIVDTDDDLLITDKLVAAEQWIGKFIGHDLWDETAFPGGAPDPIKEAIRQLVSHWYENREATLIGISADELPFGVCDLISPYREYVF